uniref:Ymf68 n=1 Tax=Ichthyophthirius multifiliis TaxID=5932 RepID=G1FLE0_ICHMU|nr:Ymf68 [Ichthyophthirius multifiliis]AEL89282.1 Ymf68 [Ichthyophthirius multifiliis]
MKITQYTLFIESFFNKYFKNNLILKSNFNNNIKVKNINIVNILYHLNIYKLNSEFNSNIFYKIGFFFQLNRNIIFNSNDILYINNILYIKLNNIYIKYSHINLFIFKLNNFNSNIKPIKYIYNCFINTKFRYIDFFLLIILRNFYQFKFNNILNFRVHYRIKQTSWGFIKLKSSINNKLEGIIFFWLLIKYWLLSIIISLFIIYYFLYIKLLPFNKLIIGWLLLIMLVYWLISGFVYFFKKYQYSKFTTSLQRFWKRTYILFWLIESCIFITFFYLTLNSSSEPFYMYDQIKIYKTHLFSWRLFLIKLIPVVFIILLGYFLQINLKWNTYNKNIIFIILITLILLYILWVEFYQIFHIINFYSNINWIFDSDEYIWTLDLSNRRTRLLNNYTSICLFAKFWHLVFIFIFWIFFIIRVNEVNRIRYFFLSSNIQNFIILYFMSWLYMYPWLKFIFRKYLDQSYFWFFQQNRYFSLYIFFNDLKLFFYSIINSLLYSYINFSFKNQNSFYYYINSSSILNFNQFKNHFVRDLIISSINLYHI